MRLVICCSQLQEIIPEMTRSLKMWQRIEFRSVKLDVAEGCKRYIFHASQIVYDYYRWHLLRIGLIQITVVIAVYMNRLLLVSSKTLRHVNSSFNWWQYIYYIFFKFKKWRINVWSHMQPIKTFQIWQWPSYFWTILFHSLSSTPKSLGYHSHMKLLWKPYFMYIQNKL